MEIVKAHLEHAAAGEGAKPMGAVFHAVDQEPSCQKVLMDRENAPLHVFGNLLDLIRPEARVALVNVMAKYEDRTKELGAAAKAACQYLSTSSNVHVRKPKQLL